MFFLGNLPSAYQAAGAATDSVPPMSRQDNRHEALFQGLLNFVSQDTEGKQPYPNWCRRGYPSGRVKPKENLIPNPLNRKKEKEGFLFSPVTGVQFMICGRFRKKRMPTSTVRVDSNTIAPRDKPSGIVTTSYEISLSP